MTDRFTIKAAETLRNTEKLAAARTHGELMPVHLLAALAGTKESAGADAGGIVVPLLEKAGVQVERLRSIIQSELDRLPRVSGGARTPSPSL